MEAPTKRMLIMFVIGLIWCIVGVVMYFVGPEIDGYGTEWSFYGFLALGGLCFVVGIARYLGFCPG